MAAKLSFKYDREGDILYINKRSPYAEQESEELSDGVIARLSPTTGEIENLEILFFSTRLLRSDLIDLPVEADLRVAGKPSLWLMEDWHLCSQLKTPNAIEPLK
jgi:uncharacterized protein YuzE